MPKLIITGANRGLGLEFVRQYAAAGWEVVATVRDPGTADALRALGDQVRVETLDVADLQAVERFGRAFSGDPIDLLIANAGTYGPRQIETAADGDGWTEALQIMAVSPVLLAQGLMPALVAAKGKAVAITSRMGSIGDNETGGFIAYRSGKAALNAGWTSLAIDRASSPVAFALLHPGWVQTRMGGASAPLEPEDSVSGMRQVIDGLSPSGRAPFLDYKGDVVPW